MNVFYAFVTSENSKGLLKKLTFDKKIYYDVPVDYQDIDLNHPLIKANSYYSAFLKVPKDPEKSYFRHIQFAILDAKKQPTDEAKQYIKSGLFVINGKIIKKENLNNDTAESINLNDTQAFLSTNELRKLYDSLDDDEDDLINFSNPSDKTSQQSALEGQANKETSSNSVNSHSVDQANKRPRLVKESNFDQKFFSTIFQDLEKIIKDVGKFKLFNKMVNDSEQFIDRLRAYLEPKYKNPDDIITYFHSFLAEPDLVNWCLKLSKSKLDFNAFKSAFVEECLRLEILNHKLVDADMPSFLEMIKINYKNDAKLVQQITDYPLTTYFKQKLLAYSNVLGNLDNLTITKKIIFQLEDRDKIDTFYQLRKDDVKTILRYCMILDQEQKGSA